MKRSILDRVRVAAPCGEDWNEMRGSNEIRFCSHCERSVHNLSQMTRRDAERLVAKSQGRLCVRYVSRADRKIITTSDFRPLHKITRRASRLTAGAFTAALTLTTAAAQNTAEQPSTNSVNVESVKDNDNAPQISFGGATLTGEITDPTGAVVPGAKITVTNESQAVRATHTDDEGRYKVEFLPDGVFTIDVESIGFKQLKVVDVRLSGQEAKHLTSVLDMGEATEVVGILVMSSPAEAFVSHSAKRRPTENAEVYDEDDPLLESFNEIASGDLEQVDELLKSGFDVNTRWLDTTPLMVVGSEKAAYRLIRAGADVQARNEYGETPLMLSARNAEVVKALLKAGGDVHARSEFSVTPLMYAMLAADETPLRLLLEAGADVNARDADGRTALMFAAMEGRVEIVRQLLAADAERDVRDRDGKSALASAREFNQEEAIKALIAAGARD